MGRKLLRSVFQRYADFYSRDTMCCYRIGCFSETYQRTWGRTYFKRKYPVNRRDGDDNVSTEVSLNSIVQEKNITYPTDDKNYKKIIKKCWKIAGEECIDLRQSYTRTVKGLSFKQRFKKHKNDAKEVRKAAKKIKTITR